MSDAEKDFRLDGFFWMEIKNCVFCRIISRELEAPFVFEDEISVGFLDHRPLFPGHCLIVPKTHYETLSDLPSSLIKQYFFNVQLLARAVESGLQAEGTFVAINNRISQSVPHLHTHVVPRRKKDGLKGFFWPRNKYKSDEEKEVVQQAIQVALAEFTQ